MSVHARVLDDKTGILVRTMVRRLTVTRGIRTIALTRGVRCRHSSRNRQPQRLGGLP